MRLWTVHPKYLDPQGLVALWRESLLAQAVLREQTRGYKNHPQLERFKSHPSPRRAINLYLSGVHEEATSRGYAFDRSKVGPVREVSPITTTAGQLDYEWQHLLAKLSVRKPELFEQWKNVTTPEPHPMFLIGPGPVESWERV